MTRPRVFLRCTGHVGDAFDGAAWASVSSDGIEFVQQLMHHDSAQRPTVEAMAKHKWLSLASKPSVRPTSPISPASSTLSLTLLSDGLHPNPKGGEFIAKSVLGAIEAHFPDLRPSSFFDDDPTKLPLDFPDHKAVDADDWVQSVKAHEEKTRKAK